MKKLLPSAFLLFLIAITSGSCIDCCKMISCGPFTQYSISVSDIEKEEVTLLIRKKYQKNQQFSRATLIDSVAFRPDQLSMVDPGHDRQELSISLTSGEPFLQSHYDYVVEIPAAGARWQIDQMTDKQEEMEYCKPSMQRNNCANSSLISFRVNGQLYNLPLVGRLQP